MAVGLWVVPLKKYLWTLLPFILGVVPTVLLETHQEIPLLYGYSSTADFLH